MVIRRHFSIVARFVLAALLFSHAALAVSACELSWRAPAKAIAAADTMACCLESDPGALAGNANLCLAHCMGDAQTVDSSGPAVPAVLMQRVLAVSNVPAPGLFVLRRPAAAPCVLAAPPRTILFQNFRI